MRLSRQEPPFFENTVIHMEAVHGQDSRSLAARHEGTAQGIRQRGFAGPRGTGNGNNKTRFILCPPKNVFDDRFKLQRHAASVSFGASLAPVMKATASDMV